MKATKVAEPKNPKLNCTHQKVKHLQAREMLHFRFAVVPQISVSTVKALSNAGL